MDDLSTLDALHDTLEERQDAGDTWDDMTMSGGLIVGLYASLDGQSAGVRYHGIGGMNTYALEGVLRKMLRDIENGNHAADADDDA